MIRTVMLLLILGGATTGFAEPLLESKLGEEREAVLRYDATGDGKPDILERWWNGKRCRWFDENGDMTSADQRGDMVGDSLQVDMDGDGFYDGAEDMNVKWTDSDGDGKADLMTVSVNPGADQDDIWGKHSHYMHFVDLDGDGVNHYIDWQTFKFDAWRHTGGANFSPDYNGDSIFIKTHLPPWALEDPRTNWENPFAFYDFDDDGCTEMAIRYLNHHTLKGEKRAYDGFVKTVQIAFDLDNDSQYGREQSFDLSIGYHDGKGYDYRNHVHQFPGLKAPEWVLPYYRYSNYRKIDELVYTPHGLCFDKTVETKWRRSELAFDEDGDDHRWERVCMYKQGDPYKPHLPRSKDNDSVVRGVQVDTLGDRTEWDDDFSGEGKLYIGSWDGKLHLLGAESGVWLVDDGSYAGSGNAPRLSSRKIAPKVGEVVQYADRDGDGVFDFITYDYDGDKTVDLTVNLNDYPKHRPKLLLPSEQKWNGLHETFKRLARKSWDEAQLLYRAAWRAGITDDELDELAIAASTWEKYDHGYWLKEKLFRKLYASLEDEEQRKQLIHSYFTQDYESVSRVIAGAKPIEVPMNYELKAVVLGGQGKDRFNLGIHPGKNPMFPTVIKIPDWVPVEQRVHPDAKYYMYTTYHSHHQQVYLSWANSLENMTAESWVDVEQPVLSFTNSTDSTRNWRHVGGLDIYLDHDHRLFLGAIHGATGEGTVYGHRHLNFMGTSPYGLNFNDPETGGGVQGRRFDGEPWGVIEHAGLGKDKDATAVFAHDYARFFKRDGRLHGMGKGGRIHRAPFDDPETQAYEPYMAKGKPGDDQWEKWWKGENERILTLFTDSEEFRNHPNNPHPGELPGITCEGWVNHVDVFELGGNLYEVFFYIKILDRSKFRGIYRLVLDARNDDWTQWHFLRDAEGQVVFDVILPHGSEYLAGTLAGDPYIYEEDGRKLMFFSYGHGREGRISCVELVPAAHMVLNVE